MRNVSVRAYVVLVIHLPAWKAKGSTSKYFTPGAAITGTCDVSHLREEARVKSSTETSG